jgi:hypothetical protein
MVHRNAPVNALGYLRVMFAVDDIDETLGRLRKRGAQLVGDVVRYQDSYRLCYQHAVDEFVAWYCSEPRLAFNKTVVLRYRFHLEEMQILAARC